MIEFKDEIIKLYESGVSVDEIAEKLELNVHPKTIPRWLRVYWNIKPRTGKYPLKSFVCEGCSESFEKNALNARLCLVCAPTRAWDTRFVKYGITKPKFEEKLEKQSGLCDLCEMPLPKDPFKVCVDHCHKQKHTRGLLCPTCNIGLGYIENDKFFSSAVKYVERHRI